MAAARVVEAFDELKDGKCSFTRSFETMADEQFAFERRIEALAHRVVVAISNRSHRGKDAGLFTALSEGD